MANDFTVNPWVIDTASATVLTTDVLRIGKIRWEGAATAGHVALVQDKNGKRIWSATAPNTPSGPDDDQLPFTQALGLIVPTLQSGKLLIYLN